MPGLTVQECADLVNSVRTKYPFKGDFAMTQQYQQYVGADLLQNRKMMVDGGQSLKATLTLKSLGTASMVLLYEPMSVMLGNVTSEIEVPWRKLKGQWSVSQDEVALNTGDGKIFDLITLKRANAMIDVADVIEGEIWSAPSSPTLTKRIWGIPYWINPLADGQAGAGFYGTCPTGWEATGVGGLLAGTANHNTTSVSGGEPRHRNFAAGGPNYYTAMDLEAIDTMENCAQKILFKTPAIMGRSVEDNSFPQYRLFCGDKTQRDYARLVRSQNDQLGAEGAPYLTSAVFHGRPLENVSYLNADESRAPIYFVPMNELSFCVPNMLDLTESDAFVEVTQSEVATYVLTMTWAIMLRRRRHAAIMRYTE